MSSLETHQIAIPQEAFGQRLDQALAAVLTDYSRSRLRACIDAGNVLVDGRQWRPRDKVQGGEQVTLSIELESDQEAPAEEIALDIRHQDDDLLVLNKPAGLVVHPGNGNPRGTLMNALLHHRPQQRQLPRAGIVHRLDKDTTGLMVVACSLRAHTDLIRQLQARDIHREYQAVVNGLLVSGATVEAPIGRHPTQRTRMAVVNSGKEAVTYFRIEQRYRAHTHLRIQLETGRTHQIRVHMSHLHHPLVGDPVYGGRPRPPPGADTSLRELLGSFPRQALHASGLSLQHPGSGETCEWQCDLPEDFQGLLDALENDLEQHADA